MAKRIVSAFVLAVFLFVGFAAPVALAEENKESKLGSFEKKLDEDKSSSTDTTSDTTSTGTTSSINAQDIAVESALTILIQFFLMGLSSMGAENLATLHKDLKQEWSPALPTIRVEPSYQYNAGNINAFSGKLEAGYLMLGVDGEFSHYIESAAKANLNIWDAHFLLRTLFTRFFGTNLALGVKGVKGSQNNTGFEFGLPFYIFIHRSFIFDVLPYMARISGKNVYDISGGLSYKYKFVGIRAAYRGVFLSGENLHGPRVGIFFQW